MAINSASTVKQFIRAYQRQGIKESDFWLHGDLSDSKMHTIVPEDMLIDNYTYEINKLKVKYTFTDEEYELYKYNPARLSDYLYGTCEYAWLLLFVNEMYSVTEFNKRTIYIIKPNDINMLVEVLSVMDDIKSTNEADMYALRESIKITTPDA